jgi:DNA-binding LacI/PurR family transcriptional regulator
LESIRINPSELSGKIAAVPSKSLCHRAIIAAGLSDSTSTISNVTMSKDIIATCRVMRNFGVEIEENGDRLIIKGNFSVESGYRITKKWIMDGTMPDAIFAADDNTAFGIIDAARKYNISIPDKLTLIGYDNHPFSSSLHPSLSTINQPTRELGEAGVEFLLNIIDGRIKRTSTITLKPELILRETTK